MTKIIDKIWWDIFFVALLMRFVSLMGDFFCWFLKFKAVCILNLWFYYENPPQGFVHSATKKIFLTFQWLTLRISPSNNPTTLQQIFLHVTETEIMSMFAHLQCNFIPCIYSMFTIIIIWKDLYSTSNQFVGWDNSQRRNGRKVAKDIAKVSQAIKSDKKFFTSLKIDTNGESSRGVWGKGGNGNWKMIFPCVRMIESDGKTSKFILHAINSFL